MAEYVRRKRPPASHPYWERLRDRAHPPPVVAPVAFLGGIGMFLGLYGGLMEPMEYVRAAKTASAVAGAASVVLFATSVPILLFDASRQMPRRERWPAALVSGLAVAVIMFLTLLLPLVLVFLWYAACSGRGPWLGMLTGLGIGTLIGAVPSLWNRRRWRERQRRWPRWERMRSPRPDVAITVTPVPLPIDPGPGPGAGPPKAG